MDHREVYLNYVSGQWKQGGSGQWDNNRNPARPSESLGKATRSTPLDADRAVESAALAQREWARKPRPARGAILAKAASLLKGKLEIHAKIITREQGKNLNEARAELQRSVQALEFLAAESRRPMGSTVASESGAIGTTLASPLGVVAVVSSYQNPLQGPLTRIASALLDGNGVVFKPSHLVPATSAILVRLFEEAGLPGGTLNLLYGNGSALGSHLLQNPRVSGFAFSGSAQNAAQVSILAGKRPNLRLDLGAPSSRGLALVLADADLDLAAQAIVEGAFSCTGQRPGALSRVVVEGTAHAALLGKILERARALKVGDGLTDPQAIGPLADETRFKHATEQISAAQQQGAALACGGEKVGSESPDTGYFIAPTVWDRVRPEMPLAQEDLSAPFLALLPASSREEALNWASTLTRSDSPTWLYSKDLGSLSQISERIGSAVIRINSGTVENEVHAPDSGTVSGQAKACQAGTWTTTKTIYWNPSGN